MRSWNIGRVSCSHSERNSLDGGESRHAKFLSVPYFPRVDNEVGVATVPGSSFYASDPGLGRGLVRFVEKRFEKLETLR